MLVTGCGNITLKLSDILEPPVQKLITYHQKRIDIRDDMIYSYGGQLDGTKMMVQFRGRQLLGFRTFPGVPLPNDNAYKIIEPF